MSYASLTGNQAISLFRDIVDDNSVGADIILSYLNMSQDELSMEREWTWLTGVDTSLVWLPSDSYLTAHAWPTAALYPLSIYVAGFDFPLREVPLTMRVRFADLTNRFYHNHATRQLFFTGNTDQSRVVTFNHIVKPTEIAEDDVEIANWPGVTHRMLVLHAVSLWLGGTDADNITKVMEQRINAQYNVAKKRSVMLDAKMRSRARGFSSLTPDRNISSQPDVVDID